MFRLSQDLVVQSTWLDSMLGPAPPHPSTLQRRLSSRVHRTSLPPQSQFILALSRGLRSSRLRPSCPHSNPWPTTHSFPSEIQEYKPRRPTYHQYPTITLISNLFFLGPHSPLSFICRSPVYPDRASKSQLTTYPLFTPLFNLSILISSSLHQVLPPTKYYFPLADRSSPVTNKVEYTASVE
ncbi:hypothetical protein PGT21_012675 [Puccinia graminis f. sp. tritici]|uniref:Uncharacterized protein n=1 Tax=Puccinia graminis f. sp. tritici TaxID=56615 RepID=A0A5B0QI11_PUCGR|nr:hypothetical protein PGT21_012675 [Puccinia graminis f. sp. tritici]